MDEARLFVRVFIAAKLILLGTYVWFVSSKLFSVVDAAMAQNSEAVWTNLTAILAAITAFCAVTVPMLSKLYMAAWTDYRNSESVLYNEEGGG
jgi:hypothetical protein